MTRIKTIIIFPYAGYESGDKTERLFWKVVDQCKNADIGKPVVVLNPDTVNRKDRKRNAYAFHQDARVNEVETLRAWAVDTCQMWLAGWGHVLDTYAQAVDRIVLLPGDMKDVEDEISFFQSLSYFVSASTAQVIIGDYNTGRKRGAKYLIDVYGTYPLFANWFPEFSESVHKMHLERPRSEFLNIEVKMLREILDRRKFAYEQTIKILVDCWDSDDKKWKTDVSRFDLGVIHDSDEFREYRGCLDQIERTERLLKVLWREQKEPKPPEQNASEKLLQAYAEAYKVFTHDYDELDRMSTQIRQTARIIIRALLGIE